MTFTDFIGFTGHLGLLSSLTVCFILILIAIYQQFRIDSSLMRITRVLTDIQTLLLGIALIL